MDDETTNDERLARKRAKYLTGLLWHINTFAIINAFFWVLDAVTGEGGVQWAHWIALFWGVALLFHVSAWAIEGRQVERRRAEQSLSDDHHAAH